MEMDFLNSMTELNMSTADLVLEVNSNCPDPDPSCDAARYCLESDDTDVFSVPAHEEGDKIVARANGGATLTATWM